MGIPYDSQKPPVAEDVQRFRERGRQRNYEFRKVERLDGGIGLLQVDGFYPAEWITETAAGAMLFLSNCEAIILDLRENHGGASGGTLLCCYFFKEETHLTDFYDRAENKTRQVWTYPLAGVGWDVAVLLLLQGRDASHGLLRSGGKQNPPGLDLPARRSREVWGSSGQRAFFFA